MPNPSLLDVFLLADSFKVVSFNQINPPSITDHDFIFLSYGFSVNMQPYVKRFTYREDYANINFPYLFYDFEQLYWDDVYGMTSVDDQINYLNSFVFNLFNKHVPLKAKKVHSKSYLIK